MLENLKRYKENSNMEKEIIRERLRIWNTKWSEMMLENLKRPERNSNMANRDMERDCSMNDNSKSSEVVVENAKKKKQWNGERGYGERLSVIHTQLLVELPPLPISSFAPPACKLMSKHELPYSLKLKEISEWVILHFEVIFLSCVCSVYFLTFLKEKEFFWSLDWLLGLILDL